MTAELVVEEDDPHFGLPDIWDGQQVVCIHFPEAEAPEDFDHGRTHIDYDGGDTFQLNITQYSFGLMVDSIAGVDPSQMAGNFSGAYWSLYHNGALSMIGIIELELDSDSVITWRVDTW